MPPPLTWPRPMPAAAVVASCLLAASDGPDPPVAALAAPDSAPRCVAGQSAGVIRPGAGAARQAAALVAASFR